MTLWEMTHKAMEETRNPSSEHKALQDRLNALYAKAEEEYKTYGYGRMTKATFREIRAVQAQLNDYLDNYIGSIG